MARLEVGYWRDTEALTRRASAVTSGNRIAQAKRGELEPAAAHFAEILKFQPEYPGARHNLELLLKRLGMTPERF